MSTIQRKMVSHSWPCPLAFEWFFCNILLLGSVTHFHKMGFWSCVWWQEHKLRSFQTFNKLNELMEPDNRVDKFAVCDEKDQTVVGYLKKGDSGKFAKTIFYFLRNDTYCNCYLKFQGNDATWKMEKGYKSVVKLS